VEVYLNTILLKEKPLLQPIVKKRFSLREFIEKLGEQVDGVAFGYFEKESSMHYL
jgi:hypothetical protein